MLDKTAFKFIFAFISILVLSFVILSFVQFVQPAT
jgi:hypothetical protein